MELESLDHVAHLVAHEMAAAPSAVVAASLRGNRGLGVAGSAALGTFTLYDLASLTKPFVAVTLARLERKGVLRRSERLGEVVTALASTPAAGIPLDWIAAHRAGFSAHERLFGPLEEGLPVDADASYLHAATLRAECVAEPGPHPPVYSDMGYLLLGLAIETRCQAPLDEIVRREVLEPLGISRTVGSSRQLRALYAGFDATVAPTENVAFRGGVIRGLVHDENAFALKGDALAGHAGLFGDALSVLTFGEAILAALAGERDEWLRLLDLVPVLARRPGGTHRAGFDGRAAESPSSGARLGPETFGHLGFTGTSIWIDPTQKFVGVLLTNRVNPTREHIAIRAARPRAYDAMFDALAR